MRRRLFLSFFIIFVCFSYKAQRKIQLEIGFSGTAAAFGWYNGNKVHDFSPSEGDNKGYKSGNGYIGFNLKMGTTFHNKNKSFNVSVLYQFLQSRDGRAVMTERSVLYSNLIGLSGGVRFFENKKIRLVAVINMYSEFATNYKDQLLLQKQYTPANIADPNIYIDTESYNIYKGTPLVGDILVGGNLKISKTLG